MAAVVINHLVLDVPVDEIADVVDKRFPDVLRELRGFERFYLVKTAEFEASMVTVWASEADAALGDAAIGPTLINQYVAPHVTAAQGPRVGKVVAEASR
jgi:hypothetical protein